MPSTLSALPWSSSQIIAVLTAKGLLICKKYYLQGPRGFLGRRWRAIGLEMPGDPQNKLESLTGRDECLDPLTPRLHFTLVKKQRDDVLIRNKNEHIFNGFKFAYRRFIAGMFT